MVGVELLETKKLNLEDSLRKLILYKLFLCTRSIPIFFYIIIVIWLPLSNYFHVPEFTRFFFFSFTGCTFTLFILNYSSMLEREHVKDND